MTESHDLVTVVMALVRSHVTKLMTEVCGNVLESESFCFVLLKSESFSDLLEDLLQQKLTRRMLILKIIDYRLFFFVKVLKNKNENS